MMRSHIRKAVPCGELEVKVTPNLNYVYMCDGRVVNIYKTLHVSSWGCPKTLVPGAPRWGPSSFLPCLDGDSMCTYLVLGSMLTKSSYLDGDSDIVYIP